jgi:hypothetical protein
LRCNHSGRSSRSLVGEKAHRGRARIGTGRAVGRPRPIHLLGSIVKLLTLFSLVAVRIGRCGDCGEVQGLPVSDRGHQACGLAVSPQRCGAKRYCVGANPVVAERNSGTSTLWESVRNRSPQTRALHPRGVLGWCMDDRTPGSNSMDSANDSAMALAFSSASLVLTSVETMYEYAWARLSRLESPALLAWSRIALSSSAAAWSASSLRSAMVSSPRIGCRQLCGKVHATRREG